MSAAITVDLSALVAMDGRLAELATRGDDLTPLMDAIGMAMEATTQERFDAESDPQGRTWKPSRKLVQNAVGAFGPVKAGKTLTDRGRLADSITHRASADRVEIGTNLIYAGVHQFGATIRAKAAPRLRFFVPGLGYFSPTEVTIPARPYLGIGGDDADTISELVADHYLEGLAA